MRKTIRVSLLIIMLACSVRAGDIQYPVTPPPPPPATGDMPNGLTTQVTATTIGFELLRSWLSLA